ncbi:hypothetical protein SCFA_380017 [anaerobic digester metagenome]|uniref:Uncharacterized protein n=1 Tax=anaerobic digester metagenome TaxID=1263854 RepID=A0A485M6T4_9ZZZZ
MSTANLLFDLLFYGLRVTCYLYTTMVSSQADAAISRNEWSISWRKDRAHLVRCSLCSGRSRRRAK